MINEEVSKDSIRFAYQASKVTVRTLLRALRAMLRLAQSRGTNVIEGEMSVKELIKQGQGASSLEVSGESLRQFKKIANKYGVDFAIVKDKTAEKPKYTVFFKAKDTDAITQVLNEYTAKLFKKQQKREQERPSLIKKLKSLKEELARKPKKKQKNRAKEHIR